jgi:diguanylate cyclase (GGDEF)-like protein
MGRGTLSLKATIRLTMMLVAWSVILTAAALFGAMRHQELYAFAAQQAATVADLAATDLIWHVRNNPDAPLGEWLKRTSHWPAVQGLALLEDGRPPLVDAPDSLAGELLAAGRGNSGPSFRWTQAAAEDGKHVAIQVQPIEAEALHAKLLVALRLSNEPRAFPVSWRFFAPLATMGLLGLCIGILWLSHEVVRPIEMLARMGVSGGAAEPFTEPTSAARYAELASLAQTLRCLHVDLDQWRSKADKLEKSLDQRVQEETRRINQTLQRTKREAWRDPLTGLHNRRMLEENGEKLIEEQYRLEIDMSIVMFDVDHFKILNDTLGHMAGDEMLHFIAQLLKQVIRREDFAVRYGGDEFLLLLPGVAAEQAQQIAVRVISLFRQHTKLLSHLDPKPSLSAGVASLAMTRARDMAEMMRLADDALYQAKHAGKNCVGVYDPKTVKSRPGDAAPASSAAPAGSVAPGTSAGNGAGTSGAKPASGGAASAKSASDAAHVPA